MNRKRACLGLGSLGALLLICGGLALSLKHEPAFYKAALAETISWEGLLTGTYDVLLQSAKGTQRLTLVREGEHWRPGDEIEQIGIIQQDVVDLLGAIIGKVRK